MVWRTESLDGYIANFDDSQTRLESVGLLITLLESLPFPSSAGPALLFTDEGFAIAGWNAQTSRTATSQTLTQGRTDLWRSSRLFQIISCRFVQWQPCLSSAETALLFTDTGFAFAGLAAQTAQAKFRRFLEQRSSN